MNKIKNKEKRKHCLGDVLAYIKVTLKLLNATVLELKYIYIFSSYSSISDVKYMCVNLDIINII